ncbi:MAG: hypothetical protein ACLRPR_07860 [Eisenbergiella sp.]
MTETGAGLRQADVIERSVARIPLYEGLDTVRIDTDGKTAWETAEEICRINAEVFT